VFSGLSALVVENVAGDGDAVVVTARTRQDALPCPVCGTPTAKVHGYHGLRVTDVPVDGRRVVVRLRVRRLVCPVLGCRRQTFREQIPGLLERHQRRTVRLAGQVAQVAREWARRCDQRGTVRLGCPLDPFTGRFRVPGERTLRGVLAGIGTITLPPPAALHAPYWEQAVRGTCSARTDRK
jgi:hypothetical protein